MIKDLKELKALLILCRKQGISDIQLGEVKIKFGDLPSDPSKIEADPADPYANFPDGTLTPEQLMFYSSGGTPEQDPENVS